MLVAERDLKSTEFENCHGAAPKVEFRHHKEIRDRIIGHDKRRRLQGQA